MEPAYPKAIDEYTIKATVTNVEQRFQRLHVAGHGDTAIFKTIPQGWFLHMGNFAFYIGDDKPSFNSGDEVIVKIRRRDAQP